MTCLRTSGVVVLASWLAATGSFAQRLSVETFSVDEGLPSSIIYGLDQDPSGRLWVLTRNAVSAYDGTTFRTYSSTDGLPAMVLGALAVDSGGSVWTVSRTGVRLYVLRGESWLEQPSLPARLGGPWTVTAMASASAEGRSLIAVGTQRGLLLWDGEEWTRASSPEGPADVQVTALAAFGDRLFVGTGEGLCILAGGALDCGMRNADPRLRDRILALHPVAGDGGAPRLFLLGLTWMGLLDGDRFATLAEFAELRAYDRTLLGALTVDDAGGIYFGSPVVLYWMDPEADRPRPLGPDQGLAAVGVTALLHDRESNVWIGGLRGLSKISSRRFLSYDRSQRLLEDEVSAIFEVEPGRFLLGHATGLSFLDGERVETLAFDRPENASVGNRVLDIAVDGGGRIWLAAHDLGLVRLAADRGWRVEPLEDRFFSVETDGEGTVWAAAMKRLFAAHGESFREVDTGFDPGEFGFYRWLHRGGDGRFYVAARFGLLWREPGEPPERARPRGWHFARASDDPSSNVYNVLAERDGTVWAATGAGLYRLEGQRLIKVNDGALRVDRPIYLLLRDPRGWLWFGTDDGVLVWNGERLRHLSVRHGLAGREVNRGGGLVDHRGRVWIGTERGVSVYRELYDRRPARAPTFELRALEAGGQPRPIAEDPQARLALGHRDHDLVFHLGAVSLSREEEIEWRYRLEGFEGEWQGPMPLASPRLRYTNLPPGRYRLRAAARRAGGPWSPEVASPDMVIARPPWRAPWFYVVLVLMAAGTVFGAHGLRVQAMRERTRELEALNLRLRDEAARRRRGEVERERLIADLTTTNHELERYTYTVSHDLKTPLVTITGFLGLLRQDLASGAEERTRRDLDRIEGAAAKMGRLLDELLELSRLGHLRYERETVDLAELAHEAVELTAARIAARGVEVAVAPGLPAVVGERTRLLEVFQNLIENAVKFLGDSPAPRIDVGVRPGEGPEPVIFVRDNGVGIAPRYHEKIFGLFERLELEVEGTGVGLAIVRRIVELHGGKIWVESEGEGRGATFCFTLSRGGREAPLETC